MSRQGREWPAWIEPLRPDNFARARMRAAIMGRAASILDARGPGSWQEVASGWATMLLPIAAVLLLFFGGLAYQAAPPAIARSPLTLEELMRDDDPEGALGMLTTDVEPSPDWALTAVIRHENENR